MTTLRFDPKSQITWDGTIAAGRDFLAWWRRTLWDLVPQAWRGFILHSVGRWTLSMEDRTWRLRDATEGSEEMALDPSLPDDELEARIGHLALPSRDRRIDVLIPLQSGLMRTVRLPAAAQARFRSVVELQIGRLFPFRPEDVHFDCRSTSVDATGEVSVEVAVVPKQTLSAFEQRLARLGLAVNRFRFGDFSFAPVEVRRTAQERLQYVLGAVAIAALLAAMILAPFLRASEIDSLTSQVRSLQAPAHRAASLRDRLRRATAPLIAVNASLEKQAALDILQRLTAILSADTQLMDLKIDGAAVRIAGYGGDAKKLVTLLRSSGEFQHVTLSGPVGKTTDGRERLEIEMSAR